jgi:hypothetical protein
MVLRKQRRAQCARGDAVDQQRPLAAQALDIGRGAAAVLGAIGDRGVVVAGLGGAAVTLHVHRPGVIAVAGEELHRRGVRPPRHVEVEGRLRGHRGAVDEQDRRPRLGGIGGALVPQEQIHLALAGPMFGAGQAVLQARFVHELAFPERMIPWMAGLVRQDHARCQRDRTTLSGHETGAITCACHTRGLPLARRKAYGRPSGNGCKIAHEHRVRTSACHPCCAALSLDRFPPRWCDPNRWFPSVRTSRPATSTSEWAGPDIRDANVGGRSPEPIRACLILAALAAVGPGPG